MDRKQFNRIKDDIVWILDEQIGVENPEWIETPKEGLRLPDSPTFDIGGNGHNVQVTYWKQYKNIRDTIKQLKVKDRSVLVVVDYKNNNDDEITRYITISFTVSNQVVFDVITKVNGQTVAKYQKNFGTSPAEDENWDRYSSKGLRYRLYWEMYSW